MNACDWVQNVSHDDWHKRKNAKKAITDNFGCNPNFFLCCCLYLTTYILYFAFINQLKLKFDY